MTCPPIRLRVSPSWILLVAAALAAGCHQQAGDAGGAAGSAPPNTNVMTGAAGSSATPDASGPTPDASGPPPTDAASETAAPGDDGATAEVLEPPVIREDDAAPPSADAIAMTDSAQKILEGLAAQVEGARVVFVDCTATPCTARVSATTLTALRTLLVKISDAFHGRTSFVARERLDGFTGHSFEADLVLDTDKPRPVPASEDELLTDPGT